LIAKFSRSASRFGFFELARTLEQILECEITPRDSPDDERVIFTQVPTLAFPVADVAKVTLEKTLQVALTFLGLLGTVSPLSPEWTEDTLLADDEGALQAFYDVFHHRAVSYLFLAWKTHVSEGAFDLGGQDALSARLRSLAGIDAWASPDTDPLPPMVALGLADHQHGQAQTIDLASAEQLLRRILPDWGLRLEPRVRRSIAFTRDERSKLGVRNSKLDGGLIYGEACDDESGLVRIHLGPVDGETYEALMPGGAHYVALEQFATRVFGGTVDVEIEVHVAADQAPATTLGARRGARLGVDTRFAGTMARDLSVRVPLVKNVTLAARKFILQPQEH
jgi:type VI secretion system protein ImpH